MQRIPLYGYAEDPPSAQVAKRILDYVNELASCGFQFIEGFPKIENGFGQIKKKIPALCQMAQNGAFSFCITDLDKAECAPSLIRDWFGESLNAPLSLPAGFVFRVAVREIESWILADRTAIADFLGIPIANFGACPDELPDPKQHLMNILRNKGRKRWHKEMLPQSSTASIGPLYNEKLCKFVKEYWDPECALTRSPSLSRAIRAFKKWTAAF